MAYSSVTATCGNTTIEAGQGTAQECIDRIATLMIERVENECEILGFSGGATTYILLRYRTTVANP